MAKVLSKVVSVVKPTLLIACISSFLIGKVAFAIDPVTAGVLANGVVKLFSKKGPDPSLALLKANRELLIKMHDRLDNIEASLAKVMIEVAQLPAEMFEQNLNAQSYNIGKDITGIGNDYLNKISSLERDRRTLGENSARFQVIKNDFRYFLINRIAEISLLSANMAQRPKSTNINALTILTAALIELSMRIELEKDYQGSPSDIYIGAENYLNHINLILDPQRQESLVSLITTTISVLQNDPNYLSWLRINNDKSLDEWTASQLLGTYRAGCYTLEVSQSYTATCERIRRTRGGCYGPPGDRDCDPPEEYIEKYSCTKSRWVRTGSKMIVVNINKAGNISQYSSLASQVSIETLPKIDNSCPINRNNYAPLHASKTQIEKNADILIKRANTLSQLQAIRDSAIQIKSRLSNVIDGNFDEISPYTIQQINRISVLDLMRDLNEIDRLESIQGTQAYKDAMAAQRKEIKQLIADQDKQIRATFDKAAKAAKWNRTLGYLKTAASLYRVYHWIDTHLVNSKAEDFTLSAEATKKGIIKDMGRTPASAPVIKMLNNLIGQVANWGSYVNTQTQLDKINAQHDTIAATIPAGEVVTYDIVVIGKEFWQLLRSDADQLRPGDAKTAGQVDIKGTKK